MVARIDVGRVALPCIITAVILASSEAPAVELGREVIATGLTSPVYMTAPPGDTSRLFVVEQAGIIKIITLSNNTVLGTPFLDISEDVKDNLNEQGLLGMAFHPDYATNGYFYVYYIFDPGSPDESRISRFRADNTPNYATSNTADENSEAILLKFNQQQGNHNAGMLAFEPRDDGKAYLYIASGDGGGTNDNGQSLSTYLAKILRIDVDEGGEGANTGGVYYDIPPSNPWAGGGALPEIWAYGLRNPFRFGFDRDTGDLYIGDVGEQDYEEINFQLASSGGGENYGWKLKEGPDCFQPSSGCDPGGLTEPIHYYNHVNQEGNGKAVIGGYAYRGNAIPFIEGHYIYSDFEGLAKSFLVSGGVATLHQDWETPLQTDNISSFGEDANGELYFSIRSSKSSANSTVYKIIPTGNDVVWVDFDASGLMKGNQANPLNLLDIGVRSVADGGQINILGDSQVTTSSETLTIDRPMTITAVNGTVSIGGAARGASTSDDGFVSRPGDD